MLGRYILRRILQSIFVIWGVTLAVFVILRLSGDPVRMMLPLEASPEEVEAMRQSLGFDRPILVQYWDFLGNALRGDFGDSLRFHLPVSSIVAERLPATALLTFTSLMLAILIAVPLGSLAAIKRGTLIDRAAVSVMLIGQAVPVFWLGIMLILVFSVKLRWLPSFGYGSWQNLILPSITLALYSAARIGRITRSSMLEVLNQDYVRTARAKGVGERRIITAHSLRNAALPVITIVALEFGVVFGGAVITETIFAWPGIGRLTVQAVLARDFPIVQAIVLVVASVLVTINLLTDISYALLDPRIRLG